MLLFFQTPYLSSSVAFLCMQAPPTACMMHKLSGITIYLYILEPLQHYRPSDTRLDGMQASRSRQGKMEKSFLSFVSTYPTWEPGAAAKQMLASLDPPPPLAPSPHYPFTGLYQSGAHMQTASLAQHGQLARLLCPSGMSSLCMQSSIICCFIIAAG